jgi:UDP-N-acetylmuramate: L-alanyl-gamma-D-glutamyl-meso-diaminopimelate ligase
MTALAGMMQQAGIEVRGSDSNVYPPMSTFLSELGIAVSAGFDAANLDPAPDLVVIGNAMSRGNPEVEAVLNRKLNYVSLPFALREFFIRGNYSCVVAGTHGKTSTSSMLAWVLESAGRNPGFFIGGIPENFGRGFQLPGGDIFVSEGDEYDSAFFDKSSKFLHYLPDLAILNNIEFDHSDIFRDFEDVATQFRRFINLIPGNGYLVACWDDPNVRELAEHAFARVITFGIEPDADWRARNIRTTEQGSVFEVWYKRERIGEITSQVFGLHNIRNILAVTASGRELGLSFQEIQKGIAGFKNVRRRLQLLGEKRGIKIFDDFAHHPTAVRLTLEGLRQRFPGSKLWALFQPRTATSKRKIFQKDFADALAIADKVVVTPLHMPEKVPAGERLSVESLARTITQNDADCEILPADNSLLTWLESQLQAGDVVLFMSNGDFNQIPTKLLNGL